MVSNFANWCQIISVILFSVIIPVAAHFYRKLNKEMHPNGGSTVRDALNRIEKRQKRDYKTIKALKNDLEAHLAEFESE